jgi:hypothetical protein
VKLLAIIACTAAFLAAPLAAPVRAGEPTARAYPAGEYVGYEFLIGEWISRSGTMNLRQTFRWGPGKSYIQYSTYLQPAGSPEQLHFDGIMVWNAKTRALDFLFAVEPGSGTQEKGTVNTQADGIIVREVELTGADGAVSHFRQTIRRTGSDTAVTSLMRRNGAGWLPNFPGAEKIEMRRTAG